MSARRTGKQSASGEKPSRGKADLARMRRMTESEIRRTSPPELAELPESFWQDAALAPAVSKEPISIRVDADVLAWFRRQGPRYQSRMHAVLRAYMSASVSAASPNARKKSNRAVAGRR